MNKEQWNTILCNPVFSLEQIILFLCTQDEEADMLFAFSPDTGERCTGIQDIVALLSLAECRSKLTKLFNILYFACETNQIAVTHVFGIDNTTIKSIYESLIILNSIEQNKEDMASGKMQVSNVSETEIRMQTKAQDAFSNVFCNMGNLGHSSINPKEFLAYLYKTSGNVFVPPALVRALYEQTHLPLCQPAAMAEAPVEIRTPTLQEALTLAGGWCALDPENKALRVGLLLMQEKTQQQIYTEVWGKNVDEGRSWKASVQNRRNKFIKIAASHGYRMDSLVKR